MELDVKTLNRYSKRDHKWLLAKAQEAFNKHIRLRDMIGTDTFRCISCGLIKHKQWLNAGHYLSVGQHSSVRFHEDNVHSQCLQCNKHLHSNAVHYRINLVKLIGAERVEHLESIGRQPHKWERIDLIVIIETYRAKCRAMT